MNPRCVRDSCRDDTMELVRSVTWDCCDKSKSTRSVLQ